MRHHAGPSAQSDRAGRTASAARTTPSSPPPAPAEIAQAQVFEELLRTEQSELQQLERRTISASQHDAGETGAAGELAQIRARIDEIDGLLLALQERFTDQS